MGGTGGGSKGSTRPVGTNLGNKSVTLTISEPSMSLSLERLSLMRSGCARHLSRSNMSPGEGRGTHNTSDSGGAFKRSGRTGDSGLSPSLSFNRKRL